LCHSVEATQLKDLVELPINAAIAR